MVKHFKFNVSTIIKYILEKNYANAMSSIKAVVVLHNYLLRHLPPSSQDIDMAREEEANVVRSQSAAMRGSGTQLGNMYRERLAEHFFTNGQVDFQWEQAFRTK